MKRVHPIAATLCVMLFVLIGCDPSIETVEHTTDQTKLGKIAVEAKEERVRRAAVEKITDQALLAKIAVEFKEERVRRAAMEKLTDQALLAKIAVEAKQERVRRGAMEKLTDQASLATIAVEDMDAGVRYAAVGKLTDQALLAKIAVEAKEKDVRPAAVPSISIQVASSTWRAGEQPYRIENDIKESLERAGFTVQGEATTTSIYRMVVKYAEKEGPEVLGEGSEVSRDVRGSSTNITCRIRIENNESGLVVWEETFSSPFALRVAISEGEDVNQTFYETALGHLQTHLNFGYLGDYLLLRLGKTDEMVILSKALRDKDTRWSRIPTQVVARLEALGQRAIPLLQTALRHEDGFAREQACEALGRIGDGTVIPALLVVEQHDRVDFVQKAATDAIAKIRTRKASELKK